MYGALIWESGIHRVQRVPTTETSGRVHTSAASVVVLAEADQVLAYRTHLGRLLMDVSMLGGSLNKTSC